MFKLRRQNQVAFQTTVSELVVRLIFGCLVIRREGWYKDSLEWVGGVWLLLAHVTHTFRSSAGAAMWRATMETEEACGHCFIEQAEAHA